VTVLTRHICPICKRDRINMYLGGNIGAIYRCPDCGYIGPVMIETNDNVPRDEMKENEKD
jgi:phage-related protein